MFIFIQVIIKFWRSMKLTDLPFPFSSPGRGFLVVSARQRISLNIQKCTKVIKKRHSFFIHLFIFHPLFFWWNLQRHQAKDSWSNWIPNRFPAVSMFSSNIPNSKPWKFWNGSSWFEGALVLLHVFFFSFEIKWSCRFSTTNQSHWPDSQSITHERSQDIKTLLEEASFLSPQLKLASNSSDNHGHGLNNLDILHVKQQIWNTPFSPFASLPV